ncbi:uncharacterized protein LOC117101986 [Anneissia japonica]|uniref:uncharacterized protein LOC117101986 n=1 Tax=Anneissia japonica TaxID=1529436 RepID=UPI0014259BBC|nr:uncharacterized protein LOC117101986 [Anneissia japonica]
MTGAKEDIDDLRMSADPHNNPRSNAMETRVNGLLPGCPNLLHPDDAKMRHEREEHLAKINSQKNKIMHKKKITDEKMPTVVMDLHSFNSDNRQNGNTFPSFSKKLSRSHLTLGKITEGDEDAVDTENENAFITANRRWRSCPGSPRHNSPYLREYAFDSTFHKCVTNKLLNENETHRNKPKKVVLQLPQIVVS